MSREMGARNCFFVKSKVPFINALSIVVVPGVGMPCVNLELVRCIVTRDRDKNLFVPKTKVPYFRD